MVNKIERTLIDELNNKRKLDLLEFAKSKNIDPNGLYSMVEDLKSKGYIDVEENIYKEVELTDEGKNILNSDFPEIQVVKKAVSGAIIAQLNDVEKRIGLGWAKRKGFIKIENGKLIPTDNGKKALEKYELKDKLKEKNYDKELEKRGLIEVKEIRNLKIKLKKEIKFEENKEEINTLTKEIILTGKWKDKTFKRYNVEAPGEMPSIGERHIVHRFANRIRQIFIEMGFEEMNGNLVESAFWNFDALFQPQDHPARELADTFYVKNPSKLPLPEDEALVSRIKEVHEDKWRYKWKNDEAERVVLRTHTTTLSARKLASLSKGAKGKYFSIGKVFRNEAIDYKHLAEFHQVEGIIVWEDANFRNLLWILKEFYRRLGFEKIMFKPSFFPYTEPSLEIHAYFPEKKSWIELGGAGIFRKEVSIPLFGQYPVLAWGLSLERPLMMELGLKDIRTFYRNDLRELDQISKRGLKWLL